MHRDGSRFTWHQPCNNQRALSVHTMFRIARCTATVQSPIESRIRLVHSEETRKYSVDSAIICMKNDESIIDKRRACV